MTISIIVGFLCWLFYTWVNDAYIPPTNRIVALILALFLGYISVIVLIVMFFVDDEFKVKVLKKITGR